MCYPSTIISPSPPHASSDTATYCNHTIQIVLTAFGKFTNSQGEMDLEWDADSAGLGDQQSVLVDPRISQCTRRLDID